MFEVVLSKETFCWCTRLASFVNYFSRVSMCSHLDVCTKMFGLSHHVTDAVVETSVDLQMGGWRVKTGVKSVYKREENEQ